MENGGSDLFGDGATVDLTESGESRFKIHTADVRAETAIEGGKSATDGILCGANGRKLTRVAHNGNGRVIGLAVGKKAFTGFF